MLVRVDTERGEATPFEQRSKEEVYYWPSRVPDQDAILFNSYSHVASSSETDLDEVSVMDLQTSEHTVVGIGGSMPRLLKDAPTNCRDCLPL